LQLEVSSGRTAGDAGAGQAALRPQWHPRPRML